MKQSSPNFKTNLIYGLIVIVPVAVIIVILTKLIEVLQLVAKSIGLESTFDAGLASLLALVFLLFICYGVGYLVQTKIGTWTFDRFEKKTSSRFRDTGSSAVFSKDLPKTRSNPTSRPWSSSDRQVRLLSALSWMKTTTIP